MYATTAAPQAGHSQQTLSKSLISRLCLAFTPLLLASAAQGQAGFVDVARQQNGGIATASSYGTYVGDPQYPWKATDGDPLTGWSSNFEIPAWLQVEFAHVSRIESVGILWGSHVHDYTVELSIDGSSWQTVLGPTVSQNCEGCSLVFEQFPIPPTDAKFIHINLLTTSAPPSHIFQASVQDLEAYASVSSAISVPFVATPPIAIDGQISTSEWTGAWTSTEEFVSGGSDAPILCGIRLLHDGSHLFIAMATPLNAGWDSKGRLRIDGDNSLTLNGSPTAPYVDIQSEVGAPGAWSGYTNYMAGIAPGNFQHVPPGSGEGRASLGQTAVSYEFKVPLSDLNVTAGSTMRLVLTASPNATQMWYWPIYDQGPAHPAVWAELTLEESCDAQNYCLAAGNSAGTNAIMGWSGTLPISNNDFALSVTGAPPLKFGIFFYGSLRSQFLFGEGMRCVGGNVQRIQPVILTDANGSAVKPLDFTRQPFASGPFEIQPFSTWNFQFWYRDPLGGPAGFNLSDGLSVTFCP